MKMHVFGRLILRIIHFAISTAALSSEIGHLLANTQKVVIDGQIIDVDITISSILFRISYEMAQVDFSIYSFLYSKPAPIFEHLEGKYERDQISLLALMV